MNSYQLGDHDFYGSGKKVDSDKPITLVTQFITSDGTDTGDLVEIRRFYKQDGKIIHSPNTTILGPKATDSITDQFCSDKKELFGDINDHQEKGGNRAME